MVILHVWAAVHPCVSATLLTLALGTLAYIQSLHHKLRHIPTLGSSPWLLLSYSGARRFSSDAYLMYQEGYKKFYGRMFKVATMEQYIVVATGETLIRELAALPADIASFSAANKELIQQRYLVGPDVLKDPYHHELVRRDLARHLAALVPDVCDEVEQAFQEYIPESADWAPVAANGIAALVVARASNRVLVGLPHCRDRAYLEEAVGYTKQFAEAMRAIARYPAFIKPLVAPFVSRLPDTIRRVADMFTPEIERRRKLLDLYGKQYPSQKNTFLGWMVDHTHGDPKLGSTYSLAHRLMELNFASIHTASSTFTHALYTLAAHPEWITPLRAEIEPIVAAEGMTKAGLQQMAKLDSFLRECSRRHPFLSMTMTRKLLRAHTFSDGTRVPAGAIVGVPTLPHQLDRATYESPHVVDPFRFEHAKDKDGEVAHKHFTSCDSAYLPFGAGKQACPGRFFASIELKAMLSYLLLHYDVRAEAEGVRPADIYIQHAIIPVQAKVLFRKRQL